MCAVRDYEDDGRDTLPRHQQDIQTLERTPFRVNDSGDWDPVDKGLWRLQAAWDLVGMAEVYVEVAAQLIPNFMLKDGSDS